MLEKCTMPISRCPGFDQYDLETRSVYEILSTEYSIAVHHAEQSLEAVTATEFEADLLQLLPGAAVMLERRLAFDMEGVPVELGNDLYRGDRFRFTTEIAPLAM